MNPTMNQADSPLVVTSHVARDLLQSAALFRTDRIAVWEYVSNGLQYVDPGVAPVVHVVLHGRAKITITDNGRGMDWDGLRNFFVMHGENLDRTLGRAGRGFFGTGKAAALGIAKILRITTVRNNKRCKVELRRADVDAMNSNDPIPVNVLERDVDTVEANGTTVEIEQVQLRRLDQKGIIDYIEQHLSRWPGSATVFVNDHECHYAEPPVDREKLIKTSGQFRKVIGDVELVLKVSKKPLDGHARGVAVYCKGVWHESTLAGADGREMSQYIFGAIDVPRIDEDTSPIPPFDQSRSGTLNPSNELVQAIHSFIGVHVEALRQELVKEERSRRRNTQEKKLARQAREIARLLNEDFNEFRNRVTRARAKVGAGNDIGAVTSTGGTDDDVMMPGDARNASVAGEAKSDAANANNEPPKPDPNTPSGASKVLEPDHKGEDKGDPSGGTDGQRRPRGGFQVHFRNMGLESNRAVYQRDKRSIFINLDHPQLEAARGQATQEDLTFRRLCYEVAFGEYSVALAYELAIKGDVLEPQDAIHEVRSSTDRLARRSAALFAA